MSIPQLCQGGCEDCSDYLVVLGLPPCPPVSTGLPPPSPVSLAGGSAPLLDPGSGLRRQPRQARSQERLRRILAAAETLFVAEGVGATTTNAIAAQAGVPIGSLYQFFPDKGAILRSLAQGYGEQLHDDLSRFEREEGACLELDAYIEALVARTARFFDEHPGYAAIFLDVQSATPDLVAIEEEADARLVAEWARALLVRSTAEGGEFTADEAGLIAYVLVKTIGNLLWLSLGHGPVLRERLVREATLLAIAYLRRRMAAG
ncbi:MAG: TetR family transcriptional regulator [Cyanobium sp.]|nr:MAG: TetR family transcriptional regulator [Cyanobium sp.]